MVSNVKKYKICSQMQIRYESDMFSNVNKICFSNVNFALSAGAELAPEISGASNAATGVAQGRGSHGPGENLGAGETRDTGCEH